MAELTAEEFAQRLIDVGLIGNMQLEAAWSEIGSRDIELEQFISHMLRKQLLTTLQVDKLKKNERQGYFYGKYKLLYLVGKGSFARVYRATHIESGQIVAVKVLRAGELQKPDSAQQFLQEARMVMPLRHINIVPVFEVAEERRRPYMVMEFVEGQNLREFLRMRKTLEIDEALSLAEDICNGLQYALKQGVTHRDLKISNVLVTSTKRAKLVDFGLAAVAAVNKELGKGTQRSIDYLGLERVTGASKDDARSDIYFAGCILYHLLTGAAPLSEKNDRSQRMQASRYREVKPIIDHDPTIPPIVVHIVNKAMELDPDRRYQTPGEMAAEIAAVRRRLEAGDVEQTVLGDPGSSTAVRGKIEREGESRSVMIVESNIEMQDALRDLLKRRGYRVLVIGDTSRAMQRFLDAPTPPADCVIFCTTEMGREAIDAFNAFGERADTKEVPAILFLDERRRDLAGLAKLSERHVLLSMPLKVRQLRAMLMQLLSKEPGVQR